MLFSDAIKERDTETQRRLYALFTRAVKQGHIPALKLLDKMEVTGKNGQTRGVPDFAIPQSAADQLGGWIEQNAHKKPQGVKVGLTARQVAEMTDDQLAELIQKQNTKKRRTRKPKAAPTTTPTE